MGAFSSYHPIVLFCYYLIVILLSVTVWHPVVTTMTLAGSVGLFLVRRWKYRKELFENVVYYFFWYLLLAVIHPLFSHDGEHILFFLNDNPVTEEAVRYGSAIGIVIIAVIFWVKACYEMLSTDKILYLLSRLSGRLALFVSMGMRFFPLMKQRIKEVERAQKTMGLYTGKSFVDKVSCRFRVFGAVVTWIIEYMAVSVSSMRARGYGQGKRSNYSIYHIRKKDTAMLFLCGVAAFLWIWGSYTKVLSYSYYPYMSTISKSRSAVITYIGIGVFFFLPSLLELKENIKWKLLKLKI